MSTLSFQISGISVTADLAESLRLGADEGVLVVEVIRGSPANRAGLRGGNREVIAVGMRLPVGGDIITAIDGEKVSNINKMLKILNRAKVGQTINLHILRNGRQMELDVILTESGLEGR